MSAQSEGVAPPLEKRARGWSEPDYMSAPLVPQVNGALSNYRTQPQTGFSGNQDDRLGGWEVERLEPWVERLLKKRHPVALLVGLEPERDSVHLRLMTGPGSRLRTQMSRLPAAGPGRNSATVPTHSRALAGRSATLNQTITPAPKITSI
jgi:hypothetical protein